MKKLDVLVHVVLGITISSIRKALVAEGLSKKSALQNVDLRHYYLHNLSDFQSYHLYMWMNLGVISGLGSDGQAGHHLARLLCK